MLPDAFEQIIKQYDPLLSLRYGDATKCWIIERRAKRFTPGERGLLNHAVTVKNPDPKAVEEHRSMRAGKRVIFYVNQLDNRVIDQIHLRDLQRQGFKPLDKHFAEREKKRKQFEAEAHEKARLAADIVHHMVRKRSDDLRPEVTRALIAQALGMDPGFQDKKFGLPSFTPSNPVLEILDAHGRSLKPKDVKIERATK